MVPGFRGGHASTIGSYEEPFAHEIGFSDGFDGFCLFAYGDGQGCEAHRPPRKTAADRVENGSVEAIGSRRIDLESSRAPRAASSVSVPSPCTCA